MTPVPIVLDCDPGHDDAIAILLALASPELQPTAITTVAGNQTLEKTTANALRILELAGRADIPVYEGAAAPILRERDVAAHVHGESGLDGPDLPAAATEKKPEHAVEFLAEDRGVIVAKPTAKAFATELNALLDDEDRRTELGARAYAFTRPMIWSETGAAYRGVFERVVGAPIGTMPARPRFTVLNA